MFQTSYQLNHFRQQADPIDIRLPLQKLFLAAQRVRQRRLPHCTQEQRLKRSS